ncbi:hypothetical protein [Thalassococcus sp. S3]|uniref:hypothetical protein n=1 Tax=Thalassococcus sp. S3 TaxID=2017482 RepID=UPI001024719E|nr:hypothetical protein [Thalassococcus sp. S3]QBF32132.1 hypothetical protein CFI11_13015 [Thalassococcus sp. S3]
MVDKPNGSPFTASERAVLHQLAEMFSEKEDRDHLRRLLEEGVTLKQIILAYKTNRRMMATLKAIGALIVLLAAVVGAIKSLNPWPK